jgi:hypothetical protein
MVYLTMSHLLASSSSLDNRKKLTDGDNSTTSTVFQSNLACVLNDPKKTRAEISTFFTKTWGLIFDLISKKANFFFKIKVIHLSIVYLIH